MNQAQPYMDVPPSHLTSTQSYTSQAGSTDNVPPHYSHYSQPPVLHHPGPAAYGHGATTYPAYGYPNNVSSPQPTSQPVTNMLPLPPPMATPNPGSHNYGGNSNSNNNNNNGSNNQYQSQPIDTTGQVQPPGVMPKVSATLWEDEATICYQVEVDGICVARRDDNHTINGTKLLNVTGMTRGRRDGILKSEKVRHVVKVGPMHLKGVWIPYERALDFANKEKITERLYPLFYHDMKSIVYKYVPEGSAANNLLMQPERRRVDGLPSSRSTPSSQAPSLHHHHSISNSIPPHMSQPTTQSVPPHTTTPRPSLERAHTFPTPPTTASNVMPIPNSGASYDWPAQTMANPVAAPPPLSMDSGLNNSRSMPTTPATTPSGAGLNSVHAYQNQSSYDSKPYYAAPQPTQSRYATQPTIPQPHMSSYSQANGQITHGTPAGEPHPQEAEYVNDTNSTAYNGNRNSYAYHPTPAAHSLAGEHQHMPPDMTNPAPTHSNGTLERVPSRSNGQAQWPPPQYPSGPRSGTTPGGNIYNAPLTDTRHPATNGAVADQYAAPPPNIPPMYTSMKPPGKRAREDDDRDQQISPRTHSQSGEPNYDFKRRKTITDASVNGVVGASVGLQGVTTGAVPRRL